MILYTCSFICQGTSTKRQQKDFFSLGVKVPPAAVPSNHLKVEASR